MLWKAKLLIKIASGKVPFIRTFLKKAGYFRHGRMNQMAYAQGVFNRHSARAVVPISDQDHFPDSKPDSVHGNGTCLEIGPGESLMTMIFAKAAGFTRTIFVDYGWQIEKDISPYIETAQFLRSQGYMVPEITHRDSLESVLESYHGTYLTAGLDSFSKIESGSVDFSFSQAVFEHIPKAQVKPYLRELRRVATEKGFSTHRIDLKDHLGGSINQLRFPESAWETQAVYQSGVYTNRLRFSHWMSIFREEEIPYSILQRDEFSSLPLPRRALDPEFRILSDEDLSISGFDVLIQWGGVSRL